MGEKGFSVAGDEFPLSPPVRSLASSDALHVYDLRLPPLPHDSPREDCVPRNVTLGLSRGPLPVLTLDPRLGLKITLERPVQDVTGGTPDTVLLTPDSPTHVRRSFLVTLFVVSTRVPNVTNGPSSVESNLSLPSRRRPMGRSHVHVSRLTLFGTFVPLRFGYFLPQTGVYYTSETT